MRLLITGAILAFTILIFVIGLLCYCRLHYFLGREKEKRNDVIRKLHQDKFPVTDMSNERFAACHEAVSCASSARNAFAKNLLASAMALNTCPEMATTVTVNSNYQAKQRQETQIVTTTPISSPESSGSMSQTNYLHIPLPTRPTSLTIANEAEKKRFLPVNSPSTKLLRKLSL